jgi:hypothetical protein
MLLHEVITNWNINFLCATEKCRVSWMSVEVHVEERMARCKQCLPCQFCSEMLVDWCQHIKHKFCWKVGYYLLTPWSRVLLEKLTVNFAASQEIPHIYGTRKFLTVPTRARHLSLSWANSIQSPPPPPTKSWVLMYKIKRSHIRKPWSWLCELFMPAWFMLLSWCEWDIHSAGCYSVNW